MAGNRKAAEKFIISMIDEIAPGGENKAIYEKFFSDMSDTEFDKYMKDLESEERYLVLVVPNGKRVLDVERNLEIGERLGQSFFQRLWIGQRGDVPAHLTPVKYLVVDLPVRRASQLLTKKISIPDHNRAIDLMSGQPTGDSKGSKVSYPELQIIAAMGMDNCAVELIKFRGGDLKGFHAMNTLISRHGAVSLETLKNFSSGVESARQLKTFLTSMHLSNTL